MRVVWDRGRACQGGVHTCTWRIRWGSSSVNRFPCCVGVFLYS